MKVLTSIVVLFGIFSVQLSVALPQASTCSCNGNISSKGSGECRTTHRGRAFCYVEQGICADEKESSQSGWFWSNQACETGTTPTLLESDDLSAGTRVGASVTQGDCDCTDHTETDHRGQQIGKCLSRFNDVTWCYVESNSNCGDKKKSSKNPGLLWSHIACQSNADSDSITTEERIQKNEELGTKALTATNRHDGSESNCLYSPGYPNKYPRNSAPQEQIIRVPDGHQIEITFHHFDVESCHWCSSRKCRWDWVEIKDGNRKVLKKLCGNSLPAPFTIPTSTATISFHSDYVVERTGYKICYKSKKQQSGRKLTFQLRGNSGEEKVKIYLDGSEEKFDLTTEWMSFSYPCPSNGQFSVEFLQDGITKDVFIQGHQSQVNDLLPILSTQPTNWGCGTSNENERCEFLRGGYLAWDGKYTWTVKCKAGCPLGYQVKSGDIPGWGSLSGNYLVANKEECARKCDSEVACASFEHSDIENKCNLNQETNPTSQPYKDYTFCTKQGVWSRGNGQTCWGECGNKGGPCPNKCGTNGFCCRKGYNDCSKEAQDVSWADHHRCVIRTFTV